MIASDVIYPAGDVDDYHDGVYRPYRSADPHFRVDAPLLGCRATTTGTTGWPASCTTSPTRSGRRPRRTRPPGWRRAGAAGPAVPDPVAARRAAAAGAPPRCATRADSPGEQPADRRRWRSPAPTTRSAPSTCCWSPSTPASMAARRRAVGLADARSPQQPGPKVLVTGKPLLVNGRLDPAGSAPSPRTGPATRSGTWSTGRSTATSPRSAATCTTSSSTRPLPADAAGPALHLVSGGGGAFVHATHTYANADHDSRVRNDPTSTLLRAARAVLPQPRRVVPPLRRSCWCPGVRADAWATCCSSWPECLDRRPRLVPGPGPGRALHPGGQSALAVVALLLLVLVRVGPDGSRPGPRRSPGGWSVRGPSRSACWPPPRATSSTRTTSRPTWWPGWRFTGFHCVAGALVRRSGWWRPADESSRNLPWPALRPRRAGAVAGWRTRCFAVSTRDGRGAGGAGRRAADLRRGLDRLLGPPAPVHRTRRRRARTRRPSGCWAAATAAGTSPAPSWCPPSRPW